MMNLFFLFLTLSAFAYVPTVESLFRHGSNPDVTVNGASLTLVIRKTPIGPKATSSDVSLLTETKEEDFYRMFFSKYNDDVLKVAQTRYADATFSADSLIEKNYYPNFTPYTIKASGEESEKGIFMGVLQSLVSNDGSFLVSYLKALGVPVRLNEELINREKVEYLAEYKKYLVTINKDRTARKTAVNPLRPEDSSAREKVDKVMNESMYIDTKQVKLSRDDGQMVWLVTAGSTFEAAFSYRERHLLRLKFRSQLGEYEIQCKDYWFANGAHSMPRYLLVRDYKGENYQVEITKVRHYTEKETDLVKRLKKWDSILKGKESLDPKSPFLL